MGRRIWARALGNVLLGMSLGLVSYYGLTALMGWWAQADLAHAAGATPAFSADDPNELLAPSGPALDFAGWAEEDLAYWEGRGAGDVFGRLVIPAMELDVLVVTGHQPADLRRGPGWIDYTDLPGPTGNCGISGHRTTYGAPFRRLGEVAAGDTIDLYSPYRLYRYQVTEILEVTPDRIEVVASTEQPMLTLTACHPPYSAKYRLIVHAELVEVRRVETAEE